MAEVLVTGGTGVLGRRLVPRLLEAGHGVRVLSRSDRPSIPEGARAYRGDLATGHGVAGAVAGVGAIVHAATAPLRRTRQTDVEGTRRLAEAARSSGSPHLVYISIVGIDRFPPFPYYRAKVRAEGQVERSGLPWTILRATQFHDLLYRAFQTARRLPVLPVPKGFRFQPVDADEVAGRLVELVGSGPHGRAPDMGGPQVRPIEELAGSYLRAMGLRKRILPLPVPGQTARSFREGGVTCPDHADGRVTWEEFLDARAAG